MARSAKIGTKTLAVAVLLQRLVMITVSPVKMRPATHPGKAERFSLTQRCVKLRKKADNASLGKLLDEHEGES